MLWLDIRSIWVPYTCLISRTSTRIYCITDEADCLHCTQDFRVCGRSSSVGKTRFYKFLLCFFGLLKISERSTILSSGQYANCMSAGETKIPFLSHQRFCFVG